MRPGRPERAAPRSHRSHSPARDRRRVTGVRGARSVRAEASLTPELAEATAVALGFGVLLLEASFLYRKSCGGPQVGRATALDHGSLSILLPTLSRARRALRARRERSSGTTAARVRERGVGPRAREPDARDGPAKGSASHRIGSLLGRRRRLVHLALLRKAEARARARKTRPSRRSSAERAWTRWPRCSARTQDAAAAENARRSARACSMRSQPRVRCSDVSGYLLANSRTLCRKLGW